MRPTIEYNNVYIWPKDGRNYVRQNLFEEVLIFR